MLVTGLRRTARGSTCTRRRPQNISAGGDNGHRANHADLVNIGAKDIRIRHLYVDGVKDGAYSVRDRDVPVDELCVGSLVRITSAFDGGTVFRFGQ